MSEEKTSTPQAMPENPDPPASDANHNGGNTGRKNEAGGSSAAPQKTRRSFALFLAWLAVFLAAGGIFAGYYFWHDLKRMQWVEQQSTGRLDGRVTQAMNRLAGVEEQLTQIQGQVSQDRLSPLQDRLSHMEREVVAMQDRLEESLRQADVIHDSLQKILKVLRQQLGGDQNTWKLAQVQFLLELANQRLQLQRDPVTAMTALTSADAALEALGDPGFLPVREQLAKEIAALNMLPQTDISGVALTIAGLVEQVDRLPVKGMEYGGGESDDATGRPVDFDMARDWRQLPGMVWDAIRELVQVRRRDEPVTAMLAPKEQYFLYQNLRLQLETARVAVLLQDRDNYQAGLLNAQVWLREYFDAEAAVTQGMARDIQSLLSVNVRPELPDISESLRLLQRIMATQLPDVATSTDDLSATDTVMQAP